jgi:hypothetical protein
MVILPAIKNTIQWYGFIKRLNIYINGKLIGIFKMTENVALGGFFNEKHSPKIYSRH